MAIKPLRPTGGATVNIDVAAASANVALSSGEQVWICNDGTATAWLKFGNDNTVAATLAAGFPIKSGVDVVLTLPPGTTHVAAIAAGATGKVYFTPASGF